jgi:signal transduction histidine kinase
LYALYRLRIAYVIKQKNKLEKEISIRTMEQQILINDLETVIAELEQSKEELYQNNLFKEKLAMIVAHDLQSPLRFLNDAIQRANEKALRKDEDAVIAITETMQRASVNIYRFIEDFVIWLKTLGKSFHPQYTWINMYALAAELTVFFNEQLKAKNNQLYLDIDDEVNIFTDYQLVKIILRNLVDNANKYTENGQIYITLDTGNTTASLKITDTGRGINSVKLKKIKSRIKNADDYTDTESGFGYRFVAAFSRQLGVSIDIESSIGSGTIVTLKSLKSERVISKVYS